MLLPTLYRSIRFSSLVYVLRPSPSTLLSPLLDPDLDGPRKELHCLLAEEELRHLNFIFLVINIADS
jgi:hypothetical protein